MKCTVDWAGPEGMMFVASTGSGHVTVMDGAVEGGGHNLAPRPMELLLAGTGGCSAYDVVLILQRGRHRVEGCRVELDAQRAQSDPKVFTHIHFIYTVTGHQLPRDAVERAVKLSYEKYCSASAMLAKTAELSVSITLIDSSTTP